MVVCFSLSFAIMKITFDVRRVMHLNLLVAATFLTGRYCFIERFGMSNLSAYALSCFLVCQISNVLMRFLLVDETPATTRDHITAQEASEATKRK